MVRITGGKVYDPANGVDGVVKDICIAADGRVVASTNGAGTRTIDATGMVIFPGGVDVHTHVAGGALNFARGLVSHRIDDRYVRAVANRGTKRCISDVDKYLRGQHRKCDEGGKTKSASYSGNHSQLPPNGSTTLA